MQQIAQRTCGAEVRGLPEGCGAHELTLGEKLDLRGSVPVEWSKQMAALNSEIIFEGR